MIENIFTATPEGTVHQIIRGRKYDKIVLTTVESGWRHAVAFIDRETGTVYCSKSWSQRGRIMAEEHAQGYREIAQSAEVVKA